MSDSQTIQLPVSPGPTPATPEPSGALATVWAAVLGEQPEPGSNFFASGGTSLGAARLVAGIRRHCEVGLKLVDVLEHPTFGELLALITRSGAAQVAAADTWTLPTGTAPVLSPNQRSRLVRDAGNVRELGRRLPHTVAVTWIADGPLDVPRLFDAARAVGSRHAALSLRVSGPDGVWGGDGAPECRVIDLPGLAVDDDRVRREVDDHAGGLIDLHDGPIWSVQVLRLSAVSHVISIAVDHLVCDGDSLPVLQRDLTEAYETREALPALPHSYFDWVAWQKKLIADSDLDEVRERIGAAPDAGTVVPGLRLRDESQAAGAPAVGVVEQRIPAGVVAGLERLCRESGCPPMHAALLGLAAALEGQRSPGRLGVLVPFANRDHPMSAGLIGWMANLVPLSFEPEADGSFAANLALVSRSLRTAAGDAHMGLGYLMERAREESIPLDGTDLTLYFDYREESVEHFRLGGATLREYHGEVEYGLRNRLSVWVTRLLDGSLEYRMAHELPRVPADRAKALLATVAALLTEAAEQPTASLRSLATPR